MAERYPLLVYFFAATSFACTSTAGTTSDTNADEESSGEAGTDEESDDEEEDEESTGSTEEGTEEESTSEESTEEEATSSSSSSSSEEDEDDSTSSTSSSGSTSNAEGEDSGTTAPEESGEAEESDGSSDDGSMAVTFADVYPILTANCQGGGGGMCHSANASMAQPFPHPEFANAQDMALAEMQAMGVAGEMAERVARDMDAEGFMPANGTPLGSEHQATIRAWADSLGGQ